MTPPRHRGTTVVTRRRRIKWQQNGAKYGGSSNVDANNRVDGWADGRAGELGWHLSGVEQRAEALAVGAADGLGHVVPVLYLVGHQAVAPVVGEAPHVLGAVGLHRLVDLVQVCGGGWNNTTRRNFM